MRATDCAGLDDLVRLDNVSDPRSGESTQPTTADLTARRELLAAVDRRPSTRSLNARSAARSSVCCTGRIFGANSGKCASTSSVSPVCHSSIARRGVASPFMRWKRDVARRLDLDAVERGVDYDEALVAIGSRDQRQAASAQGRRCAVKACTTMTTPSRCHAAKSSTRSHAFLARDEVARAMQDDARLRRTCTRYGARRRRTRT
jgi:hypothetical protein